MELELDRLGLYSLGVSRSCGRVDVPIDRVRVCVFAISDKLRRETVLTFPTGP
jgi:hypothetical protein